MTVKLSTIGRTIIFVTLGIMAVKLCVDLTIYMSDNINQIRAEKEFAEHQKQQEANDQERRLWQIEEELRRTQYRRPSRYHY